MRYISIVFIAASTFLISIAKAEPRVVDLNGNTVVDMRAQKKKIQDEINETIEAAKIILSKKIERLGDGLPAWQEAVVEIRKLRHVANVSFRDLYNIHQWHI